MTTPPVVSITDELIAELEAAANAAGGAEWMLIDGEMRMEADNRYVTSQDRIDDNKVPFAEIHYGNPDAGMGEPFQGEQVAAGDFMALANPATILALLAERADLKRQLAAASVDAERWRYARDLLHPDDIRDSQISRVSFGMKPTEDISRQCDDAIDAARNIGGGD